MKFLIQSILTDLTKMPIKGLGIDLVSISNFRNVIKQNPSLIKNVFTSSEIRWCESFFDPAERYSGRFAAKEAFYKALPTNIQNVSSWLNIEILAGKNGKPYFNTVGEYSERLKEAGIEKVFISITHENDFSVSIAVAI